MGQDAEWATGAGMGSGYPRHRDIDSEACRGGSTVNARDTVWTQERAGFVLSRKNRYTGAVISLYRSAESGIESDPELPWTTLCEEHSTLVCHTTRALAESHLAMPEWCEPCQQILIQKGVL
jgi:hypothetical protein